MIVTPVSQAPASRLIRLVTPRTIFFHTGKTIWNQYYFQFLSRWVSNSRDRIGERIGRGERRHHLNAGCPSSLWEELASPPQIAYFGCALAPYHHDHLTTDLDSDIDPTPDIAGQSPPKVPEL